MLALPFAFRFRRPALNARATAGLLQLLFWVLMTGFYFAWYDRPNFHFDGPIWSLVLLRMVYAIGLFNALVYLIIPRWLMRGRFWLALLGGVGLIVGYGLCEFYGAQLAMAFADPTPALARHYRSLYEPGLLAAVFSAQGLLGTFITWQYSMLFPLVVSFVAYAQVIDRRRLALERDQLNLELRYLKAQINPQFLFQTLSNLHGLTRQRDPRAGDMVLHLADLMRYTLYESDTETVLLSRELEFLDDYLALERLRQRPGVRIEAESTGQATAQRVVPLLLFPFVERLFASLPADAPAEIQVTAAVTTDALRLTLTRRLAAPHEPAYATNAAVAAARRRLALHYPARHTVQIHEDAQVLQLAIHLQLQLRR